MIYIIATTCIIDENRILQYKKALDILIKKFKNLKLPHRIIIVENNGRRKTFLDEYENDNVKIYYTNNQTLKSNRIINNKLVPLDGSTFKGYKELKDVKDCINYFRINDDDLIVKITGRYILQDKCPFLEELNNMDLFDFIGMKACNMNPPSSVITGLIALRCKYVKEISFLEKYSIEVNWASIVATIPDNKKKFLNYMGIHDLGLCKRII